MRLFVFFDCPVDSKENRTAARQFREFLLDDGFDMLQYSVYTRFCRNLPDAKKHVARVLANLPKQGDVRILTVTEHQYETMAIALGKKSLNEIIVTDDNIVDIE